MRSILTFFLFLLLPCFLCAQKKDDYKPGHYYNYQGVQIPGWIYYPGNHKPVFYFKENFNHKKKKKVYTKDAASFVIESDSFTVIRNFQMQGLGGGLTRIDIDFAQVISPGPRAILYKHYTIQGNATPIEYGGTSPYDVISYLLLMPEDRSLMTVRRKSKRFKEEMSIVFANRPDIVAKIMDGSYRYGLIEEMVDDYNGLLLN